ncbi:MAG: TRAP transporter small permease [Alphaproteobacteria bacterium]|nr:MAG: TRAP transporter small permease [Alphaproteobacteria bacterium]
MIRRPLRAHDPEKWNPVFGSDHAPKLGDILKFLDLLDRFASLLFAVVKWVCIVLASALFIIVVAAVVARYGFGQAVSWTEEVPRYLLVWISFLAAAVGVLNRDHVGFDVLFNALPRPVRRVLGVTLSALILMFGWIVFRYGITFVQDFGDDLMETIPFTNNWYYPAMPVCGFLIMVFAFKLIVDEIVRPEAAAITGTSVD